MSHLNNRLRNMYSADRTWNYVGSGLGFYLGIKICDYFFYD